MPSSQSSSAARALFALASAAGLACSPQPQPGGAAPAVPALERSAIVTPADVPATPAPAPDEPALPAPDAASPAVPVDVARLPVLREVWSAPDLRGEVAMVPGDLGVIGSLSGAPAIVRLTPRTGTEVWRYTVGPDPVGLRIEVGPRAVTFMDLPPLGAAGTLGSVELHNGALRWSRSTVPGLLYSAEDHSGLAIHRPCRVEVFDPADGRESVVPAPVTSSPGELEACEREPVLVGQVGACSLVLAPVEADAYALMAVAPEGPCWSVALGRSPFRPDYDAASGVLWWREDSETQSVLHIVGVDREAGAVRWRREFVGDQCVYVANMAHGPDIDSRVLVRGCGHALAIDPVHGRDVWHHPLAAREFAIAGEVGVAQPRLMSAGRSQRLQIFTPSGQPRGSILVGEHTPGHVLREGVILDNREGVALYDLDSGKRWHLGVPWPHGLRFMGPLLFVMTDGAFLVVDIASGALLGKDERGGEPLAVLPVEGAAPGLVILRPDAMGTTYLRALALP